METIARIGIDTAKSVFQLHGIDDKGQPVLRRKLKRQELLSFLAKVPATEVGLEACGASHYWAREIGELGHHVVLVPPQHVKPFVGRNKNDAADAEAICTALSQFKVRQRLVAVKSAERSATPSAAMPPSSVRPPPKDLLTSSRFWLASLTLPKCPSSPSGCSGCTPSSSGSWRHALLNSRPR